MKSFLFFPLIVTILTLPFHVYASGTHQGGHTNEDTHQWEAPAKMAERINPQKNTPESIQRGKNLYIKYCDSWTRGKRG